MKGPSRKVPMTAGNLNTAEREIARSTPGMFAKFVNGDSWRLYKHLKLLDKYLMKAVSGECKRLIVQIPPQHGKSMLISEHLGVWYLGNNPDNAVMLCSYEADYAKTWGRKARRLMEKWGPALFGIQVAKDTRAADNWEIEGRRGVFQTAGVGGPVTGKRAHLLIIDDPVKNAADAMSPTMRERNKDWFRTTSSTRLQKYSTVIVVQTRWHDDDLAGWLQNEFPDMWTVVNMPAISWGEGDLPEDERQPDPLGRAPGEALCPGLHPIENLLEKMRLMGEFWFSALYQGRPVPSSGGIFKEACFKYWAWNPEECLTKQGGRIYGDLPVELPEKFDYLIQSWDMTYKKTTDSDWVVGQIWGAHGADRYLLAQFRDRCGFGQTVKAVELMSATYFGKMTRDKLVEFRANGPAVVAVLQRKIAGFKDVEPEGSKEARAHGCVFQFESGNVYFPHPGEKGNEWVAGLLYEFKFFPAARHDDQVDCATQALAFLFEKQVSGAWAVLRNAPSVRSIVESGPNANASRTGYNSDDEATFADELERKANRKGRGATARGSTGNGGTGSSAKAAAAGARARKKSLRGGGRQGSVGAMLDAVLG